MVVMGMKKKALGQQPGEWVKPGPGARVLGLELWLHPGKVCDLRQVTALSVTQFPLWRGRQDPYGARQRLAQSAHQVSVSW